MIIKSSSASVTIFSSCEKEYLSSQNDLGDSYAWQYTEQILALKQHTL